MRLIFLQPAVLFYGSELQFNNCCLDIGFSGVRPSPELFSFNNGGECLVPLFRAAVWRRLSPLHRIFVQRNTSRAVSSGKIMQNKRPVTFPACRDALSRILQRSCVCLSNRPSHIPVLVRTSAVSGIQRKHMKESLQRRCLWAHTTNKKNKQKNNHTVNTRGSGTHYITLLDSVCGLPSVSTWVRDSLRVGGRHTF